MIQARFNSIPYQGQPARNIIRLLVGEHVGDINITDKGITDEVERQHPHRTAGWYFHAKQVYSSYNLHEMLSRGDATDALKPFVDERLHEFLEAGDITLIEGTLPQIETYLWALLRHLDRPTGGDDDTFDYWPDAMYVCHQIATDLDSITNDGAHIAMMQSWYYEYVDNHGPVPEFEIEGVTHGEGFDYREGGDD